ncbi:hypothetical protein ACLB2K_061777 [Fragaria x ananassa]
MLHSTKHMRNTPLLHVFGKSIYAALGLERRCYIERVEKVLELLSCNKLDSFKEAFFLDQEDTQVLDKWVHFAITKEAQKLDLQIYRGPRDDNLYIFPHWVLADLNVSTLKHLALSLCALKPPAGFDRFVQLTTLCLRGVEVDPDFMAHLFSACSLLENLTLYSCDVSSNLIIGPSLHLHDLKVLGCYLFGKIEIDAVNLSSLEYVGYRNEILMRTPKLVTFFYMILDQDLLPNVLTQITSCPELSTLHLLITDDVHHITQNFPTLRNLKQLKLDILYFEQDDDPLKFELGSVLNILRAALLLEDFVMTVRAKDYQGDMRNLSTFSHNHLRRIKMQGFQGKWFEIEFAISILNIATKLEVMVIDPHGSYYKGDGSWCELTCCYQGGNEDENPTKVRHHIREDENVDKVSYELWQERGRAPVLERLKDVKTDAKVIIL